MYNINFHFLLARIPNFYEVAMWTASCHPPSFVHLFICSLFVFDIPPKLPQKIPPTIYGFSSLVD
jgi:hypothetical protein